MHRNLEPQCNPAIHASGVWRDERVCNADQFKHTFSIAIMTILGYQKIVMDGHELSLQFVDFWISLRGGCEIITISTISSSIQEGPNQHGNNLLGCHFHKSQYRWNGPLWLHIDILNTLIHLLLIRSNSRN